jgi:hypothetical protein
MALNIGKEMTVLKRMTVPELRRKYAAVFGEDTNSRHKEFLIRRIVWRMQVNQDGGLSERARQRARELVTESDVRLTAPRPRAVVLGGETTSGTIGFPQDDRLPMPGAIITRRYKNQTVEVRVLPRGFEYEGEIYRTLSAVAKKVTGTHWNGFGFFNLVEKGAVDGR